MADWQAHRQEKLDEAEAFLQGTVNQLDAARQRYASIQASGDMPLLHREAAKAVVKRITKAIALLEDTNTQGQSGQL